MARHPDARRTRLLAHNLDPAVNVGGVIGDGDGIGVGDGAPAAEHAALVDANAGDALLRQSFGEQLVRRALDAKRVVAVAVGGAGTGDDEDGGALRFPRREQGALERALGAGCLQVAFDKRRLGIGGGEYKRTNNAARRRMRKLSVL